MLWCQAARPVNHKAVVQHARGCDKPVMRSVVFAMIRTGVQPAGHLMAKLRGLWSLRCVLGNSGSGLQNVGAGAIGNGSDLWSYRRAVVLPYPCRLWRLDCRMVDAGQWRRGGLLTCHGDNWSRPDGLSVFC